MPCVNTGQRRRSALSSGTLTTLLLDQIIRCTASVRLLYNIVLHVQGGSESVEHSHQGLADWK
jgi:hypothetical protein